MADTITQEHRFLSLSTPLGKDKLVLRQFEGEEAISRPYHFTLEMEAAPETDMLKLVGQAVTFSAKLPNDEQRFFHGKVLRISAGEVRSDEEGDIRIYRADVVPALSFLKFHADCRVFQEKTIPQIVEQVCKDRGWSGKDYSLKLKGTYQKLEYCVQYNESDYSFVSRLMEKAGIFYYFSHSDGGHKMVLADAASGYDTCAESSVEFQDRFDVQVPGQIENWEHQLEFTTGGYVQRDYNFETPNDTLEAKEKTIVKTKGSKTYEVFEYPGGYSKTTDGKAIATARIEQAETSHEVIIGRSSCASFSPGGKFKLTSHPVKGEINKQYALTLVAHKAIEPTLQFFEEDSRRGTEEPAPEYANDFQCIPADKTFRPPRDTPLPRIHGLQSAKVVGAKNQEILTDKYGRVKVQFPWDREGKFDDKSSCWVRVAQSWAGPQRGTLFTPRVGDEVLVDFIDGDVDRPLIVGSLYNADNMPPYKLPDDGHASGVKTFSTNKGKAKNFNELRFEDKTGKEQIYFHAERDFVRIVENNDKLKVGFETKDKGDQTIDIFNNRSVTIDKGNDLLQLKAGNRDFVLDKGNHTITIKQGDQTVKISAGQQQVEAAKKIILKVGSSTIEMAPDSIKITAAKVAIKGTMDMKAEGGVKATLQGGAMAVVKGGLVKIN